MDKNQRSRQLQSEIVGRNIKIKVFGKTKLPRKQKKKFIKKFGRELYASYRRNGVFNQRLNRFRNAIRRYVPPLRCEYQREYLCEPKIGMFTFFGEIPTTIQISKFF